MSGVVKPIVGQLLVQICATKTIIRLQSPLSQDKSSYLLDNFIQKAPKEDNTNVGRTRLFKVLAEPME